MNDFRHWMAEIMVKRKFKNEQLPTKFWNLPKFKKEYQHQIRLASKIIKVYDQDVIQKVIEKESWIYSLAVKKLNDLFEQEQYDKDNAPKVNIEYTKNHRITFRKENNGKKEK